MFYYFYPKLRLQFHRRKFHREGGVGGEKKDKEKIQKFLRKFRSSYSLVMAVAACEPNLIEEAMNSGNDNDLNKIIKRARAGLNSGEIRKSKKKTGGLPVYYGEGASIYAKKEVHELWEVESRRHENPWEIVILLGAVRIAKLTLRLLMSRYIDNRDAMNRMQSVIDILDVADCVIILCYDYGAVTDALIGSIERLRNDLDNR